MATEPGPARPAGRAGLTGTDGLSSYTTRRDATQYYVSGRFAALTGLVPVAANLLHHSIEMFIKGALSQTLNLTDLQKLGHDLEALWAKLTGIATDAFPGDLGVAISTLNRFESLRYPDKVLTEGLDLALSIYTDNRTEIRNGNGKKLNHYHLVVEDMDRLVVAIFSFAGVSPAFHTQNLRAEAKEFMNKYNRHSIWR